MNRIYFLQSLTDECKYLDMNNSSLYNVFIAITVLCLQNN